VKLARQPIGLAVPLNTNRGVTAIFLSTIYAFLVSGITGEGFLDYQNYLNYANYSSITLNANLSSGLLRVLANEPIWLLLNASIGKFFPPEATVRLIIFLSSFFASVVLFRFRALPFWGAMLILLIPLVLKNYLVHLRQGVAVAIFLLGWSTGRFRNYSIAAFIAAFVHSSFFFVVMLLLFTRFQRFAKLSSLLRVLSFLAFASGIIFSLDAMLAFSGARQAESQSEASISASGLAFVFWLSILFIFLMQGVRFVKDHSYEIGFLVFYLTAYFVSVFSGRIFESVVVTIFNAGFSLSGWRRQAFVSSFLFLFVFSWYVAQGLPLYGFGLAPQ
tara:strand:- start:1335 stop:2330 length:996 start_codon:yes stop_codon:yes gene_type:complete